MNFFQQMMTSTANVLNTWAGAPGVQRDATDDRWYVTDLGSATAAGNVVTHALAVQHPVVYDCLKVLSETVASLPLQFFERTPDGETRRLASDELPLVDLLTLSPNGTDTAFEFVEAMMYDCAWYRNAYARISQNERGEPIGSLEHLPADKMTVRRRGARRVYEYNNPEGFREVLTEDRVWHWRKAPYDHDRIRGRAVNETNAQVIGRALAVQDYGARFFANSGISGGIIEGLSFESPEAKRSFMQQWRINRSGQNVHKDSLMPQGGKYHPHDVSNDAAQFNETDQEMSRQVARVWRMPPHKVGILSDAKFANIEMQSIEFVVDTLMPWLTMIEQQIALKLILLRPNVFARFNVNGLLRGAIEARFGAYAMAIQNGWMSPDDVRRLENMNPIQGGSTYFRNATLVPLDTPVGMIGSGATSSGSSAATDSDKTKTLAELRVIQSEVEADNA